MPFERYARRANADRESSGREPPACQQGHRVLNGAAQIVGDSMNDERRALWNRDHELIAAVTAGHGFGLQPRGNQMANSSDRFSAGEMSEFVVQRLQAIDIEDEQRQRRLRLP